MTGTVHYVVRLKAGQYDTNPDFLDCDPDIRQQIVTFYEAGMPRNYGGRVRTQGGRAYAYTYFA